MIKLKYLTAVIFIMGLVHMVYAEELHTFHDSDPFPHSFLLPMAIPGPPWSYNVQLTPFLQQKDGENKLDAGAHASLGLFDWGGIHFRSPGARTAPTAEIIAMVGLVNDSAKQNGLSLLAIAGIPTKQPADGHHAELSYILGVSWQLTPADWFRWTANLHYDFTEKHMIPESGILIRLFPKFFAGLEGRATIGKEKIVYLLPSLKYNLIENHFIGIGYEAPVKRDREYDWRIYFQIEHGNH